jgi:hypothetical protein
VNDLALQVGQIDTVEISQMQCSDAGRRQIQRYRRTQSAEADNQNAALFEAQLAVDVDLLQKDLPAVAQQFLVRQHGTRPKVMRSWSPRSRRVLICSNPCSSNSSRTAAP